MISKEKGYRITKAEAKKFERSLESARAGESSADVDPRIHAGTLESVESELAVLREELERHETRP